MFIRNVNPQMKLKKKFALSKFMAQASTHNIIYRAYNFLQKKFLVHDMPLNAKNRKDFLSIYRIKWVHQKINSLT